MEYKPIDTHCRRETNRDKNCSRYRIGQRPSIGVYAEPARRRVFICQAGARLAFPLAFASWRLGLSLGRPVIRVLCLPGRTVGHRGVRQGRPFGQDGADGV